MTLLFFKIDWSLESSGQTYTCQFVRPEHVETSDAKPHASTNQTLEAVPHGNVGSDLLDICISGHKVGHEEVDHAVFVESCQTKQHSSVDSIYSNHSKVHILGPPKCALADILQSNATTLLGQKLLLDHHLLG